MTNLTLKEIRELRDGITPGTWDAEVNRKIDVHWVSSYLGDICDLYIKVSDGSVFRRINAENNAKAIAALPQLLAQLQALMEENKRLRSMLVKTALQAEYLISEFNIGGIDGRGDTEDVVFKAFELLGLDLNSGADPVAQLQALEASNES